MNFLQAKQHTLVLDYLYYHLSQAVSLPGASSLGFELLIMDIKNKILLANLRYFIISLVHIVTLCSATTLQN